MFLVVVEAEVIIENGVEEKEEPADKIVEDITEKIEEENDVDEEQEIMKKRELLMKGMLKGGGKKKPVKKTEKP